MTEDFRDKDNFRTDMHEVVVLDSKVDLSLDDSGQISYQVGQEITILLDYTAIHTYVVPSLERWRYVSMVGPWSTESVRMNTDEDDIGGWRNQVLFG